MAHFWNGETEVYNYKPSDSGWTSYLCVKELSVDPVTNRSVVGFGIGTTRAASEYDYIEGGIFKFNVTANGKSYESDNSSTINRAAYTGGSTNFVSKTFEIEHDPDGTYTLIITKCLFDSVNGVSPADRTATGTVRIPLTTIPRDPLVCLKESGTWKQGKPWIKTNGTWIKGKKVYVKNGVWKETPLKG